MNRRASSLSSQLELFGTKAVPSSSGATATRSSVSDSNFNRPATASPMRDASRAHQPFPLRTNSTSSVVSTSSDLSRQSSSHQVSTRKRILMAKLDDKSYVSVLKTDILATQRKLDAYQKQVDRLARTQKLDNVPERSPPVLEQGLQEYEFSSDALTLMNTKTSLLELLVQKLVELEQLSFYLHIHSSHQSLPSASLTPSSTLSTVQSLFLLLEALHESGTANSPSTGTYQEIAQFKKRIASYEQEMVSLKSKNDTMSSQKLKLQSEMKSMQTELQQLRKQLEQPAELHTSAVDLEKMQQLQEENKKLQEEMDRLQAAHAAELNSLKRAHESSVSDVKQTREQLLKEKRELDQLSKKLDAEKQELEKDRADVSSLKQKVTLQSDELAKELASLKVEQARVRTDTSQLEREVQTLKSRNETLQEELGEWKKRADEVEEQKRAAAEQRNNNLVVQAELQEQVRQLEEEVVEATRKRQVVEEQFGVASAQVKQLEEVNEELENKLKQVSEQANRSSECEQVVESYRSECKLLRNNMDQEHGHTLEALRERDHARAELIALQDVLSQLKAQLHSIQDAYTEKVTSECSKYRRALKALQSENDMLHSMAMMMKHRVLEQSTQLEHYHRYGADVNAAQAEDLALQKRQEELEQETNEREKYAEIARRLQLELSDLHRKYDSFITQSRGKDQQIAQLKSECSALRQKLSLVESSTAKLKDLSAQQFDDDQSFEAAVKNEMRMMKVAYDTKLMDAAREVDRLRRLHAEQLKQLNDVFTQERRVLESRLRISDSRCKQLEERLRQQQQQQQE